MAAFSWGDGSLDLRGHRLARLARLARWSLTIFPRELWTCMSGGHRLARWSLTFLCRAWNSTGQASGLIRPLHTTRGRNV